MSRAWAGASEAGSQAAWLAPHALEHESLEYQAWAFWAKASRATMRRGRFGNAALKQTALTHDSQPILQLRDSSLGASEAVLSGCSIERDKQERFWWPFHLWKKEAHGTCVDACKEAMMSLAAQILWQGAQCHTSHCSGLTRELRELIRPYVGLCVCLFVCLSALCLKKTRSCVHQCLHVGLGYLLVHPGMYRACMHIWM